LPTTDGQPFTQPFRWQGRWAENDTATVYDFRSRFWSTELGAFVQPDAFQFLSRTGTLWSWPGQNPFRHRDPYGMYSWEEFGDDFYHNADTAIDVSLAISGAAFTIATLGAGWEVGAALMGGRLGVAGLLRFGAIGAAQGGLAGAGIETGRQLITSDCPLDVGKIGKATAGGAAAGFIFGARGGIGVGPFRNLFPGDAAAPPLQLFSPAQVTRSTFTRRLNYVVLQDGRLVMGRISHNPGGGHIDLAGGAPVRAAGEVSILRGQLRQINNASGHYRPSGPGAQAAAERAFGELGFSTAGRYVERF
jgi:RHS repeat-associated protein